MTRSTSMCTHKVQTCKTADKGRLLSRISASRVVAPVVALALLSRSINATSTNRNCVDISTRPPSSDIAFCSPGRTALLAFGRKQHVHLSVRKLPRVSLAVPRLFLERTPRASCAQCIPEEQSSKKTTPLPSCDPNICSGEADLAGFKHAEPSSTGLRARKINGKLIRRLVKRMIAPKGEEKDIRDEFMQNAMEGAVDKFDKPTSRMVAKLSRKLLDTSAHKLSEISNKFVGNLPHKVSQLSNNLPHKVSQLSNNFPAAKVKHLTNLISQPGLDFTTKRQLVELKLWIAQSLHLFHL